MKISLVISFIVILYSSVTQARTKLTMDLVEYPPRSTEGPPVAGFTVDLVNAIFKGSPYRIEYRFVPWPRTFVNIKQGHSDLILYVPDASHKSFESSVDLGKVLFKSRVTLFYNKKRFPQGFQFREPSDLKGKLLGTLVNQEMTKLYQQHGIKETNSSSLNSLFQRLRLNRIDVVSADDITGIRTMEQIGKENFGMLDVPLMEKDVLLVISKKNKDFPKIRKHIDQRMKEIIASGTYQRLLDKIYRGIPYPDRLIPQEY